MIGAIILAVWAMAAISFAAWLADHLL